jgi:hypothetical protein
MAISRRIFLLGTSALSVGCYGRSVKVDSSRNPEARLRAPAIGQSWRYAKRDAFTGKLVETQVERIADVGDAITIQRQRQADEAPHERRQSLGTKWWEAYGERSTGSAELQSEVQQPWGMILVDPHWDLLQVYRKPIPLWPTELRAGWSSLISTKFKTPLSGWENSWQQTMQAHAWEKIRVPAGEFLTLRYTNYINFTHADFSRMFSVREEVLWFAPDVGRWVSRRTSGTYYIQDSIIDTPFDEGSYHWDLLDWS